MNQPASPASRKRTLWIGLAVAGVALIAAGSHFLDIPPSSDNVAGTITPAQRYRAEQQLTTQDVKLADQTISQLLQNDTVVKLVKDPQFQSFAAHSAVFAALSGNPKALEVMTANASSFNALSGQPKIFQAVASQPAAFHVLANHPQVFAAIAANPGSFAAYASSPAAMNMLSVNPQAFFASASSQLNAASK